MPTNSIKISPKHGLNPTIPICCWCGNEKNEVALMGKISKDDRQAPMHMILDYEPCDSCANKFGQGVTFIETTSEKNKIDPNLVPIGKNNKGNPIYPTFSIVTLKTEAAQKLVPSLNLKAGDKCFMGTEDFRQIFSASIQ